MTFAEKLAALSPGSRSPRGRARFFTDAEWQEIVKARERGVTWETIYQSIGRYKSSNALQTAFIAWKKKNA